MIILNIAPTGNQVWIAAATGHPAILRLVLGARADLSIPDRVGRSALWSSGLAIRVLGFFHVYP